MATTGYATGTFSVKRWDESPFAETEGAPKLTHADVTYAYEGDLEGEGTSQAIMSYRGESASFAGYERVEGTLDGRRGSFVLRGHGDYEDGVATTVISVVPGSGTGELAGLRGQGVAVARGDKELFYQLAYYLE